MYPAGISFWSAGFFSDAFAPDGSKIRIPLFEVMRIDSLIAPLIRTQRLGIYFKYNTGNGMLIRDACRRQLEAAGIRFTDESRMESSGKD